MRLVLSVFRHSGSGPFRFKRSISTATMGIQKRLDGFFTSVSSGSKRVKTESAAAVGLADDASGNENADQLQRPVEKSIGICDEDAVAKSRQEHRALANRNHALAKQAVIRCEQSGTVPMLGDLLVEESWRDVLKSEFDKGYFKSLEKYVRQEWTNGQLVFPPKDCVFRAFNSCPLGKVRVVILGQDPYHDIGQAQGLSFSVPRGKQLPSSLRNIYKEISEDVKGCRVSKNGCLEPWTHQGVLLLNSVLTVKAHAAASHSKRGWEEFTTHAVRMINKEREGVVFMLWGKYAQEKGKLIDTKRHHVLTSPHPSGLSAHRGFFGCRHFSRANELLEAQGQLPIDWQISD